MTKWFDEAELARINAMSIGQLKAAMADLSVQYEAHLDRLLEAGEEVIPEMEWDFYFAEDAGVLDERLRQLEATFR